MKNIKKHTFFKDLNLKKNFKRDQPLIKYIIKKIIIYITVKLLF